MAVTALPTDYAERVYAGVLGKIIGVYLGRPFEGWTYERICRELGEVDHYLHDSRGAPLIVTDDDISGTFTFLRALPDYGNDPDLTAGADRPDLAQLPHRAADHPLVGRHGQLHRAHRLPAPEARHPGPGQRLDRTQRQGGRRADRRADLHRRLGHGRPRRPRAGRRPGPPRRQRQPRRRGDLRRAGDRRHGGAGLRRARPRQAARHRRQPHPRRLDHLPPDRRPARVARRRSPTGARRASAIAAQLRLRQATAATATWCPTTP